VQAGPQRCAYLSVSSSGCELKMPKNDGGRLSGHDHCPGATNTCALGYRRWLWRIEPRPYPLSLLLIRAGCVRSISCESDD
jgi:hypothetical protein